MKKPMFQLYITHGWEPGKAPDCLHTMLLLLQVGCVSSAAGALKGGTGI